MKQSGKRSRAACLPTFAAFLREQEAADDLGLLREAAFLASGRAFFASFQIFALLLKSLSPFLGRLAAYLLPGCFDNIALLFFFFFMRGLQPLQAGRINCGRAARSLIKKSVL